jgi:hypothetical protein
MRRRGTFMMYRIHHLNDSEVFVAPYIALQPAVHPRYFHNGFTDAVQRVTIFDNMSVTNCCG